MSQNHEHVYTRRVFIRHGLTLASCAASAPWFLQRSALALSSAAGAAADGRILVVVQLGGGNDGLNTVIPVEDDAYRRARPGIGIGQRNAIALGAGGLALHPSLANLKSLYDDGLVNIVQGVGYPNPNRSHFRSMDIWHTADPSGRGRGWLGRYFDNECAGAPAPGPGVALGVEAPLAMQGQDVRPVSFESPDALRWRPAELNEALASAYDDTMRTDLTGAMPQGSDAAFLMRTGMDARVAGDRIRSALDGGRPFARRGGPLAQQLSMVASMIRAGLPTRVYYTTLGGFDTHAGQGGARGRHGALLEQFATSVRGFYDDLRRAGLDDRVLTMAFSEFGRRVAQNASGGTDHGAAAPAFLLGPMVRPGLTGRHPSLTDLDEGDLKHGIDFRSLYATVLRRWLEADDAAALGRRHPTLSAIRRS